MRSVVQRVRHARVSVDEETVGEIAEGILLLVGISADDTDADLDYTIEKVLNLRIFDDADGKMNLSLAETGGGLLIVSQFTLYGDVRKGRRPSYIAAAPPNVAAAMFDRFVAKARERFPNVQTGRFQAMMQVELTNDGPVTILIDSKKEF